MYGTLLELSKVSNIQPLGNKRGEAVLEMVSQQRFADAVGAINDSLNDEMIVKRYSLFLQFMKDLFFSGNMRIEELKSEAGSN